LATLNSELLGLFDSNEKLFLIIAFLAYIPLSYYFHAFSNDKSGWRSSILFRFLTFLLITIGLGLVVYKFAQVAHPEMFIANFGIVIPIVLTITFIIFNAHEIVNSMLYLVTDAASSASKNTARHYIILTSIYLLNLLYAYMVSIGAVNWGILYINAFVLWGVTIFLSIWGFKRRETHYKGIMSFAPVGALFYLSLAMISLAVISYTFATANDSLKEVFHDVILYTHLALGIGFFLYSLTNFLPYIQANQKVYKVIYEPRRLDFIWIYVLGGVLIFFMLSRSSYFIYNQSFAGYYSGVADTYRASNDLFLSEQYYKTSIGYDYQSSKANYALGSLYILTGNPENAYLAFNKAVYKEMAPFAYSQLADLLMDNNRLLDAIFKLQEGLQKYPKSGELHLKLGLLFTNTNNLWDSAFYHFERARPLLKEEGVAAANIYATLLKNSLLMSPDSLKVMLKLKDDLHTDNNELVLYNANRLKTNKALNVAYLPDSTIFGGNLCYFYNYALNQIGNEDSLIWTKLRKYRNVSTNGEVMIYLDLIDILRNRYTGDNLAAYQNLDNLYRSLKDVSYFYGNLAGIMMIEQEHYDKAIPYLASAARLDDKQARLNYAIALSEVAQERNKAIEIWNTIVNDSKADSTHRLIARDMLNLIETNNLKDLDINGLDDINKYRFVHYNRFYISEQSFSEIVKSMKEPNYQLLAAIDRIHYYLSINNPSFAESIRNSLTGVAGIAPEVQQELIFTDLKLLYKLKKYNEIGNLISNFKPTKSRQGYHAFFNAVYLDNKGDSLNAERLFKKAMRQLPLNSEVPMELAVHYNKRKQSQQAYNVLVENLELYEDYHSYPTALYEMYILQCLEMKYISFAEDAIMRLEEIASKEEFAFFKKIFDAEMAKVQAKMEDW
jgi:predicted Zn-dependent protease